MHTHGSTTDSGQQTEGCRASQQHDNLHRDPSWSCHGLLVTGGQKRPWTITFDSSPAEEGLEVRVNPRKK
jgi:hypothetical protein